MAKKIKKTKSVKPTKTKQHSSWLHDLNHNTFAIILMGIFMTLTMTAVFAMVIRQQLDMANADTKALPIAQLEVGSGPDIAIKDKQACYFVVDKPGWITSMEKPVTSGTATKSMWDNNKGVWGDKLQATSPLAGHWVCPLPQPTPFCYSRPTCLDAKIPCKLSPPRGGQYCPVKPVTNTCYIRPACLGAKIPCVVSIPKGASFCQVPPVHTCYPRPECLNSSVPCIVATPHDEMFCPPTPLPTLQPKPTSRPSPTPSCYPRPACMDSNPTCRIVLAPGMTFCPPSPKPITSPIPTSYPRMTALPYTGK